MRAFKVSVPIAVLAVFFLSSGAEAATYKIDPDHTAVTFKVRHLFTWVRGKFAKFEGTVQYKSGKPETWSAEGWIDAASIDTGVATRDTHLRSKDFFDTAVFPKITFKTGKVEVISENKAKVEGILSIHGVEKPIILDVDILGIAADPWDNVAIGFSATTTLNRKDFGIIWNQQLDSGGLFVGEEVMITLDISALQQKETLPNT